MPDVKDINNVYLIIGFIVPGLITFFIRSQFVITKKQTHTDNILSYVVFTSIYYAIILPALPWIFALTGWATYLGWVGAILGGPALLGIALGLIAYFQLFRKFFALSGVNPIHAVPSSWDWRFGSINNRSVAVMVTLSDNTKIAGIWGGQSFASSDAGERDIYIEHMYSIQDDGSFLKPDRRQGVLIVASQIRYIEFFDL